MDLARAQKMPIMCVARPRNWICPNSVKGGVPTIYDASHGTDGSDFDTGKLQSAVVRALWPVSFQPVYQSGDKRIKVVMSITTWNRVDYLQECIESFMATRSPNYDWVLIVADDGSEDGTLEYLDSLKVQIELHVIRNKSRAACGQTNTIFELSEKIGYDFGFKIDDDVIFMKPGWDDLYIQAAKASGYPHLCHSNWKAFTNLRRRTQPDFNPPPPHVDASDKGESIVDVWACHGCLFTFTPEVIEKIGYCDEPNFPIRGQWHIDYSIRACRAGLNDPNHFYDARDANQFIDLQENTPTYRCSLPWGDQYKKTKDPAEMERRLRVMRDESRIYVPLPTQQIRSLPSVHTRKTVNAFFQNVYVLNLDRHEDRLAYVDQQMKALGIQYERYRAVDGKAKPHIDDWTAYAAQPLASTPEGIKPVGGSKDFYQNFENRLARVPFLEEKLKHKAIRTPGAWGYMKSYIGILEDAIDKEYETILILDDDALFHRDFTRLFAKTVGQLPEDWKIFQLGALQYDWGDDWIKQYSDNLYLCQGSSVGSHATGIHRSVIGALLHQAKFLDLPLDVGALSHIKNTFADQCLTALPNLIIQDTSESDIASSEVQQGEGQKQANTYRWTLSNYTPAASARATSSGEVDEPRQEKIA
jgi:glycosyltransferase involved in cell wall biosynthesis